MKAPEEKLLIDGPAGKIEVIMERPDAPKGIALIAHPLRSAAAPTPTRSPTRWPGASSASVMRLSARISGVSVVLKACMTKDGVKRTTCWP
jgi:hypothetical protein